MTTNSLAGPQLHESGSTKVQARSLESMRLKSGNMNDPVFAVLLAIALLNRVTAQATNIQQWYVVLSSSGMDDCSALTNARQTLNSAAQTTTEWVLGKVTNATSGVLNFQPRQPDRLPCKAIPSGQHQCDGVCDHPHSCELRQL
jgi:hypothetical protein